MTEEQKKSVAVFRFGVISDFVNGIHLDYGEGAQLLEQKCARKWEIPCSGRTRIGRSTIQRWVALYKESGCKLESLYPSGRSDAGKGRSLDEETELSLRRMREEMPKATAKVLVKEMKKRRLILGELPLSCVYRVLHRHGLMTRDASPPEDRRKFEAEMPNDIWQSDVLHGPSVEVDGKKRKSYLIAFIDDHSRLIPFGAFYLSESIGSFLTALEQAFLARGLPRKLYVDNGAAFRSKHLEYILASLGIVLVHSRPYKPQGRGKVERFFRTVRAEVLNSFVGNKLEDLNGVFSYWLRTEYHIRNHGTTGESPFARFTSNMACMRTAPENLKDHFRKMEKRRIANDRTLTLNGRLYEGPITLIGKRVDVLYHVREPERIEIVFQGLTYGFHQPVNPHVNCRVRRTKNDQTEFSPVEINNVMGIDARYQGGRLFSKEVHS
jgi:transposase InsO family protein